MIRTPPPAAALSPARSPTQPDFGDAAAFGHKTANLARLAGLLGERAVVPPFFGVSHAEVLAYLGPACHEALEALRASFANRDPRGPLAAETVRALAEVRAAVHHAFASRTDLPGGARVEAFVRGQAPSALMVRSTGHEDSDVLANAGGNESVANVPAEPAAVRQAMGRVVASYFSERSVGQRLLAGDDVAKDAFVPLLLQRMVGEQRDGAVPSSGVLFTQESEGPTPGVSQIQAAFGHNEGVVTSLLPADTYLVDAEAVHRVVRRKPERLVPELAGGLRRAPNAVALRAEPALSNGTARRLHDLGQHIQAHYAQPMDVEWTYDPATQVLYVLQARPLLAPTRAVEPSHVDAAFVRAHAVLRGEVVGAGGGTVRELAGPQDAIVARTLAEALAAYLARPNLPGASGRGVQAVFVADAAEPTSHEATTLRGAQVPVVRTAQLDQVRALLQGGAPLLLDAQSGTLLAGAALFVDGRPAPGAVVAGWGEHPLPARESLGPAANAAALGVTLAGLARRLTRALDAPPGPLGEAPLPQLARLLETRAASATGANPSALLRALQTAPNDAERAQATLDLLALATRLAQGLRTEPSLARRADALLQATYAAAARALAAAERDPRGLAFFYELGWLRAALTQQPSAYAVATESFVSLLVEQRQLRALNRVAGGAPVAGEVAASEAGADVEFRAAVALAAAQLEGLAMRPELQRAFGDVALQLQQSAEGRAGLAQLALQLQLQGVAPVWLNTAFVEARAQAPEASALELLQTLLGELDAGDAAGWLAQARGATASWLQRGAELGGSEQVRALVEQVVADSADAWGSTAATRFRTLSTPGKLQVLAELERTVQAYDATIKAITGNPALDGKTKLEATGALLTGFAALLPTWLAQAAPTLGRQVRVVDAENVRNEELAELFVDNVANARAFVDEAMKSSSVDVAALAAQQLHPSAGFDVAAAQLGSCADYDQQRAKSFEDHFTLLHQSLLQVVGSGYQELGLNVARLPPTLQAFVGGVLPPRSQGTWRYGRTGLHARVLSIEPGAREVAVRLNVPMREHGMALRLTQRADTPGEVQMQVDIFSGYDEQGRNLRALVAAYFLAQAVGGSLAPDVTSRFARERPVARWQWRLPVDATASQAQAVRACLLYVERTSYPVEREERELSGVLREVAAFYPGVMQARAHLDVDFFVRFPWYNDAFFRMYVDEGLTHTPAFAALQTAIARRPPDQQRRWEAWSDFDVPLSATQPAAPALLRAWRRGGQDGVRALLARPRGAVDDSDTDTDSDADSGRASGSGWSSPGSSAPSTSPPTSGAPTPGTATPKDEEK